MPGVTITRRRIWEGSDPEPLARVVGRDEAALQGVDFADQANGIDFRIYELNDATPKYVLLNINVDTGHPTGGGPVIHDVLKTDGRWKAGPPGYNFSFSVRAVDLAAYTVPFAFEGGKVYILEFFLKTISWGNVPLVFEYEIVPLQSV